MVVKETKNKKMFENSEKKEVTIPIDQLNKKDAFVPVSINGYIWKIKRGVEVKIITPYIPVGSFLVSQDLSETERGEGGFGSTGT